MTSGRYILDGKVPVPCEDLLTWAEWIENGHEQRIVKQEYVGPFWVSTVFMGLDHNFLEIGPPRLFETMIFRDANDDDLHEWIKRGWSTKGCPEHLSVDDAPVYRTSTWELALEQHTEAVMWAREHLSS